MTSVPLTLLSSHNWNTLFMGPNAVADTIAQKYNATKSQVFDHVSEKPLCGVVFMASLSQGSCLVVGRECLWFCLQPLPCHLPFSPDTGSVLSLDTEHTT